LLTHIPKAAWQRLCKEFAVQMGKLFIIKMDKFKAKLFKIKVENKAVKLEQRRRKGRKAMKMPNKHGGAVIRTPSKEAYEQHVINRQVQNKDDVMEVDLWEDNAKASFRPSHPQYNKRAPQRFNKEI
ncbi:hypothetical protein EV356DRAFT_505164, partial [Viridothelium virens]